MTIRRDPEDSPVQEEATRSESAPETISVSAFSRAAEELPAPPVVEDAFAEHQARGFLDGATENALTLPFSAAPRASGYLEYFTADGARHRRLLRDKTAIGRHTDNDIQLLDPEVSKAHLVIERSVAGFLLRDLRSANGTLVNGTEAGEQELADRDVVTVGNTRLQFFIDPMTSEDSKRFRATGFDSSGGQDPERTVVTLIPDDVRDEGTNVFAAPMDDGFRTEAMIGDELLLRRDYERLRVAFDLACSAGLQTDLTELGELILARILDVLPADTAVVMLRDESGALATLTSYADHGMGEVRIPKAIVDKVLETREALLTSDAQADQALRSSHTVVGQRIRSALCVPLIVADEVLGVIHLSSSSAAGAYEERDLALLRAIAQPAALSVANARLLTRIEGEARTRERLSRFLSPALLERVVRNDISLETTGETVLATVLFADIRGFTSMSDGIAPARVVSMLNEYFEAMVEVVFDEGGVLDKFIGDELMAVWGTPVQSPEDADQAVAAARRMRHVLDTVVNAARTQRGEPILRAGYGIATGHVIAGAMGAERRQDFTVIGDTVNLASRLCSQATAGQVLLCGTTAQQMTNREHLNALEPRTVKGVARPVPLFEAVRSEG